MTDERKYVSDSETWEVFIGGLTPQEFCQGFISMDAAINYYLANYPFDDPQPSWLRGSLMAYIDRAKDNEIDWFQATMDLYGDD